METQEVKNLKELLAYTRQLMAETDGKLREARRFIGAIADVEDLGGRVGEDVRSRAMFILQRIM